MLLLLLLHLLLFSLLFPGTTGGILMLAFLVDMIVWYKAGSLSLADEEVPPADDDEMKSMTEKLKPETCV